MVALAIALIPGGGDTANLVLAALSLGFIAAIGFLGYRLYMDNRFTLWSMTTRHRAMLYGGIAGAVATLTASSRLWESGFGTVMWFVLLPGAMGCLLISLLFRIEDARYQAMLVVGLAGFMAMVLFVIFSLDRPFQGDMAVTADSYQLIYDQLMKR